MELVKLVQNIIDQIHRADSVFRVFAVMQNTMMIRDSVKTVLPALDQALKL
jgi:hypothetical protein